MGAACSEPTNPTIPHIYKVLLLISMMAQKDKRAVICRFFCGHGPFVLRSPAYLSAVFASAPRRGTRRTFRYRRTAPGPCRPGKRRNRRMLCEGAPHLRRGMILLSPRHPRFRGALALMMEKLHKLLSHLRLFFHCTRQKNTVKIRIKRAS